MTVFTKEENQTWANSLPGKMCSTCLVVRAGNKALMVKASYKDHWTFPGGIVDTGETPKQAALREMREETGYEVEESSVDIFKIIFTLGVDGDRDRFNIAFVTDVKSTNIEMAIPNNEIAEYTWVEFKDIAQFSNNKASYLQFQASLLNPSSNETYKEV